MSDFGDKCYKGDDVLSFDANIGKLKDAFTNLLPQIIDSVKAHATLGEISDTLREVFGEY